MKKLFRIVAIALWTIAAFWGWVWSIVGGVRLYLYFQQKYHWSPPPEWPADVIFFSVFGFGTIAITVSVLILGMRGRLPGTSRKTREPQGFPIMPISASDQN